MSRVSKKVAICEKKLAPCDNACPAGEDIQRWLSLVKEEKYHQAWEVILQKNPFPAIHGRVCYHQCEVRCNRGQYDESVEIHCVERFIGDMAIAQNWPAPVGEEFVGKKVLVVGAGPAGLSAAYYLRLMGIDVTIYEALSHAGGMMLTGIPAYRLPRKVLASEIKRLLDTGIKIEYNRKVDDVIAEKESGNFDAVFLAIGARLAKNVAIQLEKPCKILDAIDYLKDVSFNHWPDVGNRLVVYGGGNTAIDVARTAKRLGVSDITIVYHRTPEKMSAFPHEVEAAKDEGIEFKFLRSVISLSGNMLTLAVNELDEKGRPKHTDKTETIEIDAFVFALSQIPDSDFLKKVPGIDVRPTGVVSVDKFFMTGEKGIFAGGNMIPYERSVTYAVGHGRSAANYIDAYLNNTIYKGLSQRKSANFEDLNVSGERAKVMQKNLLDADTRLKSFIEIVPGVDDEEVLCIAKCCFSCGNCFGCGKCYSVCPVHAIAHSDLDGRVTKIDPGKCIGCGKCFKVCPSGAISMVDR